ncbi:hypothetical protein ES703_97995 [subsurface metagenome]
MVLIGLILLAGVTPIGDPLIPFIYRFTAGPLLMILGAVLFTKGFKADGELHQ